MAHEILSVKLHEMDQKISRIYSYIQVSESADHAAIKNEIAALRRECRENEQILQDRLKLSKSRTVNEFSDAYDEIHEMIEKAKKGILTDEASSGESPADKKLLFAEYSLDFAMQAVDHALLISLEAIDDVMTEEESEAFT